MRRAFHRLITTAAVSTVAVSLTAPALADPSGGITDDSSGGDSFIKTIATDEGSNDGGGGSGDGGGGGGDESSSGSGESPPADGSSGPRTERVDNTKPESVDGYSSGAPNSAPSRPPDNSVTLPDGSTARYTSEGAYVQGRNGGPTAYVDGMTRPQAEPADPQAPAAPQQPAPPQPAAPQVNPAELAQTAVSQMHLTAPEIASAPNDPDTLGAVGLPVWLWVANPGPTTTGPNSTSATAGDVTVTATATFSGMTIDMGDGTTIECTGPGTEYPGTGIEHSPDCGHVYEQMSDDQPGGLYTVNITAHWAVDWESNSGEGGQIPVDLTTDKQLRIGSYQSVVTDVT
ncbi:hypothetical protein [Brachybacterium fresconis]|uniref:ATP/GTP-binding protein n=1 Tax=Brachybacterium fresconis TaxID=173363 RepID=A0ABS4YHF4_9MICO|nr:hypothetical protein [Brachybacterium fresconis]MBP2407308.1 hypothetical protein [Brachybacterium fresconis]